MLLLFNQNKKCCLICSKRIKSYKYIYNKYINNICFNCFENCLNIKNYRKLKKNESSFFIYQNKNLINYNEDINLVKFVLYHPFGNIIRSVELCFNNKYFKIELSQERIAYKRNRMINITDNILLYQHYHILNKDYDNIFDEILYYNYPEVDSIFIQIFNTPDNFFKSIEKYKKLITINTNINLLRLFDDGTNINILQMFANKFDETFPFCNGQQVY